MGLSFGREGCGPYGVLCTFMPRVRLLANNRLACRDVRVVRFKRQVVYAPIADKGAETR